MSDVEQWGPGQRAVAAPPFDSGVLENGRSFDLVFGDHPHSRSDNNIYARFEDGTVQGFDGHRPRVDVSIHSYNYLKQSHLSGDEVRKGGRGTVSFDGCVVASFFFRDPRRALLQAHRLIDEMLEFPVQFWRGGKLVGRCVWYDGQPARITSFDSESGEVYVTPDGIDSFACPRGWEVDARLREAWAAYSHGLRTELLSPSLGWFRESK